MSVPETKRCIFCGGSPTTVEDVFPLWLNNKLPRRNTRVTAVRAAGAPGLGPATTFKSIAYRAKAKVVCGPCNNVWMSGIENRASTCLKSMLFSSLAVSLDNQSQLRLATWAMLKGLLVPYLEDDGAPPRGRAPRFRPTADPRIVPSAHYDEFEKKREPWKKQVIYLAQHDGTLPSGAHTFNFMLTTRDSLPFTPPAEAYGVTFHIDKLVVQVFGHSAPAGFEAQFPQEFGPYVVRVWPVGQSIVWPPPHTMDARTLIGFRSAPGRIKAA